MTFARGALSDAQRAQLARLAAESLASCRAALKADGFEERRRWLTREDWSASLRTLLVRAELEDVERWRMAKQWWVACEGLWWELATSIDSIVRAEAVRFSRRWSAVAAEDLEQTGLEAAYRAAQTWDPGRSTFQRYARRAIRLQLKRTLNNEGEDVGISATDNQLRQRLIAELNEMERQGQPRSRARAAERAGIDREAAEVLLATLGYAARLDHPAGPDSSATLAEGLRSGRALADEQIEARQELERRQQQRRGRAGADLTTRKAS